MAENFKLAVLVSGEGTNLQVLIDRLHNSGEVTIAGVGSNKQTAKALERAAEAGVETAVFELADYPEREERDLAIAEWIDSLEVDLVVLAGYMQLLTGPFLERFPHKIINIHPSLLPAFPGVNAIEQAVEYGVKVFGVTVHYVDEGVDTGEIIAQRSCTPSDPTDLEAVRSELQQIEHQLLPQVISELASSHIPAVKE